MNWTALLGMSSAAAIGAVVWLALAYRSLSAKLWAVQVAETEARAKLDVSTRLNSGMIATLKERKKYVELLEKAVLKATSPDRLAELLNELYSVPAKAKPTD